MHFVRRAALRAASSAPPASFVSKSRSINTSSPFGLRLKTQQAVTPSVFRRFAHEDAERKIESADNEDTGAVRSAINSASETASTYAGHAAESISQGTGLASDAVTDGAIGAAAGSSFAPAEPRQHNNGYNSRDTRAPRGSGSSLGESDRYQRNEGYKLTPTSGIYVGNLLFDITAADLEKQFAEYGTIKSATIAQDSRGLSKGFGYVEFETTEQASAAIEARHETVLEGRRLIVNYMAKTSRERPLSPPSKTLFIGNLAFEMSDADLNKLFREVRNVIDVRVAIDRRTGQPRGFAHADFVDIESAEKAKGQLDDKEVHGRKLRVDFSSSRGSRGADAN